MDYELDIVQLNGDTYIYLDALHDGICTVVLDPWDWPLTCHVHLLPLRLIVTGYTSTARNSPYMHGIWQHGL